MNIIPINNCCYNFLKTKSDNYFDLGDADPPYFKGPEKRGYYGNKVNKLKIKRRDYPITNNWEVPDLKWFLELKRTCKKWIIWGANYFDFIGSPFKTPRGEKELKEFIKNNPKNWIIWDKCNGKSSFNDFELAYTNLDIPTTIFKFMWNGMLQGKSMTEGHIMQGDKSLNQKRIHPTEKPIILYDWIYKNFTKPDFKIVNTHAGSFSCALSAMKFQFDEYYCLEIEKIYFDLGVKRINIKKSQGLIEFPI